jgi:hypothetical protein
MFLWYGGLLISEVKGRVPFMNPRLPDPSALCLRFWGRKSLGFDTLGPPQVWGIIDSRAGRPLTAEDIQNITD